MSLEMLHSDTEATNDFLYDLWESADWEEQADFMGLLVDAFLYVKTTAEQPEFKSRDLEIEKDLHPYLKSAIDDYAEGWGFNRSRFKAEQAVEYLVGLAVMG